jgi:hypothetical protein
MKQLFSTFAVLLITVLINNANAQHKSLATENNFRYDAAGKAATATDVNKKALKDFDKSFRNVANVKWYTVSDGFFASFYVNGIETKVAYDKKGNWHCTVRILEESQLPFEVRDGVKRMYYDSKILVCYEIKHTDGVAYIVKTEDNKSLKTLRVINGEVEIIGDYTRG